MLTTISFATDLDLRIQRAEFKNLSCLRAYSQILFFTLAVFLTWITFWTSASSSVGKWDWFTLPLGTEHSLSGRVVDHSAYNYGALLKAHCGTSPYHPCTDTQAYSWSWICRPTSHFLGRPSAPTLCIVNLWAHVVDVCQWRVDARKFLTVIKRLGEEALCVLDGVKILMKVNEALTYSLTWENRIIQFFYSHL